MNKYTDRDERKSARQSAILEAVSSEEIATQNDLVKALKKRGIAATQVSISRDVAELGLIKAGGAYRPARARGHARRRRHRLRRVGLRRRPEAADRFSQLEDDQPIMKKPLIVLAF